MIKSSPHRRKTYDQLLRESDETEYKLKSAKMINQEREGERKKKQKNRFLFDILYSIGIVLKIERLIKFS